MQCMFCGKNEVSREHLWGSWWQEYYPANEKEKLARGKNPITIRDDHGILIQVPGQFSNNGDSLSQTTKVVCEDCNNGWMSVIEDRMKSVFHSLYIDNNTEISKDQMSSLQKWLYLKFCLIDRAYEYHKIISKKSDHYVQIKEFINRQRQEAWTSFYENREVQPKFHCSIGRATKDHKIGAFNFIPLVIRYMKNDVLHVQVEYYCLYLVGDFVAVLTSIPSVTDLIKENFRNIVEIKGESQELPVNKLTNGRSLEDSTLAVLEKGRRSKFRRNFKNKEIHLIVKMGGN